MACEEIIMAPDAEIGDAGIDETTIAPATRSAYKEIANAHKNIPAPVALGMLDKNLKVLKVTTEAGTEYVLSTGLDELKKHHAVQNVEELAPTPGLYSGRRARSELGFVSYLAKNRAEVAQALGLPESAVRDDPSLEGGWKPVEVPVKGLITTALATETQRKIREQIDEGVNFICIWIDTRRRIAAKQRQPRELPGIARSGQGANRRLHPQKRPRRRRPDRTGLRPDRHGARCGHRRLRRLSDEA